MKITSRIIIFLLFGILTFNSHVANSNSVKELDDIYDNLHLSSIVINESDEYKVMSRSSPFIQVLSTYKFLNKEFVNVRTLNIFGECIFHPYPIRLCARINKDQNRYYPFIHYDETGSTDRLPYFQPFNHRETLESLYKELIGSKVINLSGSNTAFEFLNISDNINSMLQYDNNKDHAINIDSIAASIRSLYPLPSPKSYKKTFEEDFYKNQKDNIFHIERICNIGEVPSAHNNCLVTSFPVDQDKIKFRVYVINSANLIPKCGTYYERSFAAPAGYKVAKNVLCANIHLEESAYRYPMPLCPNNYQEDYKGTACVNLRGKYDGYGNLSSTRFVPVNFPIINQDFSLDKGGKFSEKHIIGVIPSTNYQDIVLDINNLVKGTDYAGQQYLDFKNYRDAYGDTVGLNLYANYYKNDDYICIFNNAQVINCIKRPALRAPKIYKCQPYSEGQNQIFSSCEGESFSHENPRIVVAFLNYENDQVLAYDSIKANETKTILGYEFTNIPLRTKDKKIPIDENGVYISAKVYSTRTNGAPGWETKGADKVCLYGYRTNIANAIFKKKQANFQIPNPLKQVPFSFYSFWKDAVVSKNPKGYTELQHIPEDFNPLNTLLGEVMSLHDEDLGLCIDVPPHI